MMHNRFLMTGSTATALLAVAFIAWASMTAYAVQPDEIMPDAAQESRARVISGGLRCLVCQNQSIDDSDAPLARDLRLIVRERIKAGDTDKAVVDFVVARYGDYVLLKPPFNRSTLLLWVSPIVILLGGLWLGRKAMTGPRGAPDKTEPLSANERAELDAILGEQSKKA